MILTEKLLKELDACKNGLDFCKRNKLYGFDLDRLGEVDGDYFGFIWWIVSELRCNKLQYDDNNNLIRKINKEMIYDYNEHGNIVHIEYAYTHTGFIDIKYDDRNNRISHKHSIRGETTYEYDDHNNLLRISYPNGSSDQYEYDERNNLIYQKTTDALTWVRYKYDDRNNLIHQNDSRGIWISHEYDENNKKIQQKHSNGRILTWAYDDRGNIIKHNYGDDRVCTYQYDDHDNITLFVDSYDLPTHAYFIEYYDNGQLKIYDELHIPLI